MGLVAVFKKALEWTGAARAPRDGHGGETKEDAADAELRIREVTAAELLAEMGNGAGRLLLLDIREPYERVRGFIPGSLHIAMNSVPDHLRELDPQNDIVVYCAHGNRSYGVTGWLIQRGYKARSLKGGIVDWRRHHGPVEHR